MNQKKSERLAKKIARAGLCSRREAERWIRASRIRVDGKLIISPAITVNEQNIIEVDGKPLPKIQQTRLWRYHKPAGLLTTHCDPEGRPTVFENLPLDMGHVISVGRLDLNSEGLLLLTNDGELARRLELPSLNWERKYRVRVRGKVNEVKLKSLKNGVTISGIKYRSIEAKLDSETRTNAWLTLTLTEGKNREIRKVMEHIDLNVNRLIRISFGPFRLAQLGRNQINEIPAKILRNKINGEDSRSWGGISKIGWAKSKKTHMKKNSSENHLLKRKS